MGFGIVLVVATLGGIVLGALARMGEIGMAVGWVFGAVTLAACVALDRWLAGRAAARVMAPPPAEPSTVLWRSDEVPPSDPDTEWWDLDALDALGAPSMLPSERTRPGRRVVVEPDPDFITSEIPESVIRELVASAGRASGE